MTGDSGFPGIKPNFETSATMNDSPDSPTTLVAGAASAEITPPLEVGLLMASVEGRWEPFEGVRMPLFARAVVLGESSTGRRVALVALDLLGLSGTALGGFREFKSSVCAAADHAVAPEDLILTCTHTHTGPESVAITDLYRSEAFAAWAAYLAVQIGRAIRSAARSARPCRLEYGSASAPGLAIHRRFKTTQGVLLSHPEPPPEIVLSRDGAVDDSVNVAALRDLSGRLVAVIVNATCHPVHEMCIRQVSPDYPGELSVALEAAYPGAVALFLNGAAGDINPTTVSAGPAEARRHADALAETVQGVLSRPKRAARQGMRLERRELTLPTRLPFGRADGQTLPTEVVGLRLGELAFVFLPGEPFAETGLAIKDGSPFDLTAVVAYAEDAVGYVPTDQAFADGGYETTFGRWSYVAPGSETVFRGEASALLNELHAAAFEARNGSVTRSS